MGILDSAIIDFLNIKSESLCYCGSGKRFKDCCMVNTHDSWLDPVEYNKMNPTRYKGVIPPSVHRDFVFGLNKKCILCDNEPIKSHTISSNWLRKSFDSGFVSVVLSDKDFVARLTKVPIKKASVYPIRCKYHDNEIFKPIDNDIDIKNNYHLNLLAYRALGREYVLLNGILKRHYSKMMLFDKYGLQWQHAEYYKRSLEMFELTDYVYKGIQKTNWNGLAHKVYKLGKISPVFLSESIHYDREKDWRLRKHIIILSILTIDNIGYFVISFRKGDNNTKVYCKNFDELSKSKIFINLINSYIGKRCENIICDENRNGEFIQSPEQGGLLENGEHDYIKRL